MLRALKAQIHKLKSALEAAQERSEVPEQCPIDNLNVRAMTRGTLRRFPRSAYDG
ncbi:hypothetical protein GCM10007874_39770 [Labrys miyagiensis]|uniref:Transposase n=1 Tax=Labrys miyagiensis TaxID=346912 RepID=A0ABQ6CLB0_9HYPH|nr:hypothetical protein GCM10007874_39770 [Labrys miyagiensis]